MYASDRARPPSLGAGPFVYPNTLRGIPSGDRGTAATLLVMAELALSAQADPFVVQAAQRIAGSSRSSGRRFARAQIRALRGFLQERVRFVLDPVDVETIKAPRVMLQELANNGTSWGDCDDIATLGAALGLAVGFLARFVVVGFDAAGPFSHVWTELQDPATGEWVELDTSRELQGFPEGMPASRRSVHYL